VHDDNESRWISVPWFHRIQFLISAKDWEIHTQPVGLGELPEIVQFVKVWEDPRQYIPLPTGEKIS
jgi:hypothetical protein